MGGSVVVLSGGQDSTTCLFWAKKTLGGPIHALTFDYGQKHSVEIESAKRIAEIAEVDSHEIVELGSVLKSTSPLVNSKREVGQYASTKDLPGGIEPTFVPGRNALFIVLAANRAMHHNVDGIVLGVCEADFGGYPDCRRAFIEKMARALDEGMRGQDSHFPIHTPLMTHTKAQSVHLARSFGEDCWKALAFSHTCYRGEFPPCLKCHACLLRARGFYEAGSDDPLVTRAIAEGLLPAATPGHGLLEVMPTKLDVVG